MTDLIHRHKTSSRPIHGVVYDSFMPWAVDVAKDFGIMAATFFTQPCSVNLIYYCFHEGLLSLPISEENSVAGLPPIRVEEMPSFFSAPECYPNYFELVLNQWSNTKEVDWILVNSIYEFEPKVLCFSLLSHTFPLFSFLLLDCHLFFHHPLNHALLARPFLRIENILSYNYLAS